MSSWSGLKKSPQGGIWFLPRVTEVRKRSRWPGGNFRRSNAISEPLRRTPWQGEQLTAIESFINHQLTPDGIEGFRSFEPKKKEPEAPRTVVPVFGRRVKRYSNRL